MSNNKLIDYAKKKKKMKKLNKEYFSRKKL